MNIFVVDKDPVIAARMLCDKHVGKMLVEAAQLLCTKYPAGTAPYRRTHMQHPCAVWVRQARDNYLWLITHALALNDEYMYRWRKATPHKSCAVVAWCQRYLWQLTWEQPAQTPFTLAMPTQYHRKDPVAAYRAYYCGEKAAIATWTRRTPPTWWK